MGRIIFVMLILAGLVAIAAIGLSALSGAEARRAGLRGATAIEPRTTTLQTLAYVLLTLLMTGVGTGLMTTG